MKNNLEKDIMAQRIRSRRLELGYTMQELAEKVGVQKSAVCKWEKGSVSNIPTSRLKQLASALECDPVWLIGIPEKDGWLDGMSDVVINCVENHIVEFNNVDYAQKALLYAAYLNASEKDKKAVRTILDLPDNID